jgi:predicted metal-dependent hydrolase
MLELQAYANDRLSRWRFDGWKFAYALLLKDDTVIGGCHHETKQIVINVKWVNDNPFEQLQDVIIHELAHAKCKQKDGHGQKWYDTCMALIEKEKEYRPDVNFISVIGIKNL